MSVQHTACGQRQFSVTSLNIALASAAYLVFAAVLILTNGVDKELQQLLHLAGTSNTVSRVACPSDSLLPGFSVSMPACQVPSSSFGHWDGLNTKQK